ncbi:hypothetical protein Tco_0874724 [Tanacetum coccineum]|uniref:Uncharacterized protein n=1 Tax=Tanacetum coccineum TaxID=301880 RepID=A0ABQ5BQF3_9ASTR
MTYRSVTCNSLPLGKDGLTRHEAGRFSLCTPEVNSIADVGCEPTLHMRHYQVSFCNAKNIFYQLRKNSNRDKLIATWIIVVECEGKKWGKRASVRRFKASDMTYEVRRKSGLIIDSAVKRSTKCFVSML